MLRVLDILVTSNLCHLFTMLVSFLYSRKSLVVFAINVVCLCPTIWILSFARLLDIVIRNAVLHSS